MHNEAGSGEGSRLPSECFETGSWRVVNATGFLHPKLTGRVLLIHAGEGLPLKHPAGF